MRKRLKPAGAKNASEKISLKTSLSLIFNRNFSLALFINLMVMIMFFLVVVTGASYVLRQYGTSLSIAGLSSGTTMIGCLVGRLFGAYLFSIIGGKKLLFYGLGSFCLSFALTIFLTSLGGLFLARFVAGCGAGICIASNETIATLAAPRECKGLAISIFSLSVVLGLALGPFVGILLTEDTNYQLLMLALLLACLPLGLAALFIKNAGAAHKIHRKISDLYAYIDPRALPFSIVIMIVFAGYGCIQIYLTAFAAQRGLTEIASVFFIVYGATAVASRPVTGRLFDAGMVNGIIYPLFLITIAGLLALAWAQSGLVLLLAAVLCGIGFGNLQSVGQALSISLVTPTRYAQATSTFFNLMNIGIGFGPYLCGYAVGPFGYAGMFIMLAGTVLASAILYYFLQGRF